MNVSAMEGLERTVGYAPELNLYHFITLGVAALALAYLQPLFSVPKDRREPPLLHSSIPVIGHLLHLIKHGSDYLLELERHYHQSIYMLIIGKGRMYVVTSPEWAQAIHKSHKSLRFNTIVCQAMKNVFLMDEPAMELIEHNANGEDGTRSGILLEMHDMLGSVLAPSQDLDDMNRSILSEVLPAINGLAKNGTQQIQLWGWLRYRFSVASTTAIWGPKNPFLLYPDVEPAFWEFEAAVLPLSMAPLPCLLARKGYKARQRVFNAFEEYFENSSYKEPGTSQLVRNRVVINLERHGLSKKMVTN